MTHFADKYQFKNHIKKLALSLSIDSDFFDQFFSKVFFEIFEKELKAGCIMKKLNISITQVIADEVARIDKKNKASFLLLFEDYLKMNAELDEIIIRIENDCEGKQNACESGNNCSLNLSRYPYLCDRTNNIELKSFMPDHTLNAMFLQFTESIFGRPGIFFLYNSEQRLMFIGRGENLGTKMLEAIWERNIDGYASVVFTASIADSRVYEPYYIIKESPLLNVGQNAPDCLSIVLPELEKTEMIKIFEK
jgi:hypothetical protein